MLPRNLEAESSSLDVPSDDWWPTGGDEFVVLAATWTRHDETLKCRLDRASPTATRAGRGYHLRSASGPLYDPSAPVPMERRISEADARISGEAARGFLSQRRSAPRAPVDLTFLLRLATVR